MLHLWIIFQLVIDQSFKLIEKLHKIKKRFLKVVGMVSRDRDRDEHDVEAKDGGHEGDH